MKFAVIAHESGTIAVADGKAGRKKKTRFNLCQFVKSGGVIARSLTVSGTSTLLILDDQTATKSSKKRAGKKAAKKRRR